MTEESLFEELSRFLRIRDRASCFEILRRFRQEGGAQKDALGTLDRLRCHPGVIEDDVLDVMDIAGGWCMPCQNIWDTVLLNIDATGREGVVDCDLFRVEGFEYRDGKVALLPGIPQKMIAQHGIGDVSQGDAIELLFPDGTTERTTIDNYYVHVPAEPDETFDITKVPIVICLPADFVRAERVIEGTRVRLARGKG